MSGLVAQWRGSGISQRRFASDHGISFPTFKYWLGKFKPGQASPADFIELEVPAGPTERICINYPGGVQVLLPPNTPVNVLRNLVRA